MQRCSTEIPVMGQEVERKFWDSVEWLEKNRIKGSITEREYKLCIITLFKATAGLVSDEATQAMSETLPDSITRRLV